MIVYRVECKICPNHHGPTCAGRSRSDCFMRPAPDYGTRLEPPQSDFLLQRIESDEVCGTLRVQFNKWWGRDYYTQENDCRLPEGYRIAVYSVPPTDVRVGTNQVLFKRDRASVIRIFDHVPTPFK